MSGAETESDEVRALRRRIVELEIANQELNALNEIKNQFVGMAAHDLRGPIGSIRGLAELVRDLTIPVAQKNDLLNEIVRGASGMLELLDDLLDISSIESGHIRLAIEPVDLAAL